MVEDLTLEEKDKDYEEGVKKLEAKYKMEEEGKRDDKKKNEREKKKEKEKTMLRERSNKITEGDLIKALEYLNPKSHPSVAEVRDMIWEVDEDMDRCVNYEELEKMYRRCSRDKEGIEPRKLFNLIQFLMFLNDFTQKDITAEDTLQLLFIRNQSDRNALDEAVKAIFGEGKGKDEYDEEIHLDYSQYLERVNKMALDSFKSTKKAKEQSMKQSTLKGGKGTPGKTNMATTKKTTKGVY